MSLSTMLYSYNNEAESAKALAKSLGIRIINHENSKFKGDPDRWVINWGASTLPEEVRRCNVLNEERAVYLAVNKLHCLDKLEDALDRDIPVAYHLPTYVYSRQSAESLVDIDVVYCRTRLTGHDGAGIVLARNRAELVDAPLYTKRVNSAIEYRITVFNEEVIAVQLKTRADGFVGELNQFIRTTEGGWGFRLINNNDVSRDVRQACVDACSVLGLNFAGIDVLIEDRTNYPYILEINTAPQLTPVVCQRLATAIRDYIGNEYDVF